MVGAGTAGVTNGVASSYSQLAQNRRDSEIETNSNNDDRYNDDESINVGRGSRSKSQASFHTSVLSTRSLLNMDYFDPPLLDYMQLF